MTSPSIIVPQVGTTNAAIYCDEVAYVRTDPASATRCYVGLLTGASEPLAVAQSALTTVNALSAAMGITVAGQPTAPFAPLALVAGGTLYTRAAAMALVRVDPVSAARCFIGTVDAGSDAGWHINASAGAVLAALAAAEGVTPTSTGALWQWAAGAGLVGFDTAIAYGWDVTPWAWSAAASPFAVSGQVIQGTGEASGQAIALLPINVDMQVAAGALAQASMSANVIVNAPNPNGIAVGLACIDTAKEVGVFIALEADGAGVINMVKGTWDGGTTLNFDPAVPFTVVSTAMLAELIVDAAVQLGAPGAPPLAGLHGQVSPGGLAPLFAFAGPSGPPPAAWNDAAPVTWAFCALSRNVLGSGAAATASFFDAGLWPRTSGGKAA